MSGYKEKLIQWAVNHPGGLWADNEGAAAARKWLSANAPEELSALYWNESDEIRRGIDRRFVPEDAKEKEMEMGVSDAMNDFGNKMYNVVDTATAFMPGPVGTLNWLAHMGANGMQGKWGNVALDLGMAGVMAGVGKGLKALNDTGAVKNLKEKAITSYINAHPNSKLALKHNFSTLDVNNTGEGLLPYKITSLGNNRFRITGFDVFTNQGTAKKIGERTINVPSNIPEDVAEAYVKRLARSNLYYNLNSYRVARPIGFTTGISDMNKIIYNQSKQLLANGYDKKTLNNMLSEYKKADMKDMKDFARLDADSLAELLVRWSSGLFPKDELLEYKIFPKLYRDITRKLGMGFVKLGLDNYPYLKEILRESPQYSERAQSLLKRGLSEEDVVKQLLQDRFTFARGVGVDVVPADETRLFTVPEVSMGGRSDISVFPDIDFVNEDALYTSNSLPTAYSYSYPNSGKNSRVGIWYRDPASFDLTGTPLDWWQNPNNRLPSDIVKVAPSTVHQKGWLALKDLYFGDAIVKPSRRVNRTVALLDYMAPKLTADKNLMDSTMHHYLFRGKRGSEMPLPNMKLKIFDTTEKTAEDLPSIFGDFISDVDVEGIKSGITRQHHGVWTPGFSLGNALGGPLMKRKWKDLSSEEREKIMSIYVQHGYNNAADIQKDYDGNYAHYMEANPDFMQRLRDNDTTSVANSDGSRSTHKLSYVEGDNGSVLFPIVQRGKDGLLKDHTGESLDGYWSAEEKGDTVNVSTPFAEWISKNYKKDFPVYFENFVKEFANGGPLRNYQDGGKRKGFIKPGTEVSTFEDKPEPVEIKDSVYKGMSYEDVCKYTGAKKLIDNTALEAGVPEDKIAEYWNEGRLLPMMEGRYPRIFHNGLYYKDEHGNLVFYQGAKKPNTSKTSISRISNDAVRISSDVQETTRNRQIYGLDEDFTLPNLKYGIQFLPETGIVDLGNGSYTTYNALDSLAKYGVMEKLTPEEYLGLPWRETQLGRYIGAYAPHGMPQSMRAYYNMNYFNNYGFIPAENLVNDWAYNRKDAKGESVHSKTDMPPLQHAFRYFKSGKYNPGEPGHTDYVLQSGRNILSNPGIQEWMAQSKYVDHGYEDGGAVQYAGSQTSSKGASPVPQDSLDVSSYTQGVNMNNVATVYEKLKEQGWYLDASGKLVKQKK